MIQDTSANSSGPLAGYRVIDFGQYIAGPLAAMLLADQGAEVIRVDPPTGPKWQNPANAVLNRGKKSITLDLKQPADVEIARSLILSADAVIENFRPGVMDRLGLGARWARAANPNLVYLSLPGFPTSDARRSGWRAWEGVVNAATSHYRDTGYRTKLIENRPVYTALPMASYYAGIQGAFAVALGLLRRATAGGGTQFEVPLSNASVSPLGFMALSMQSTPERYQVVGSMPLEIGRTEFDALRARGDYAAMAEIYGRWRLPFWFNYRCADDRLLFVCASLTGIHMDRLIEMLDLAEILDDMGMTRDNLYEDLGVRIEKNVHTPNKWSEADRTTVRNLMADRFATRPAQEWEEILGAAGIPCSMQRTTEEYVRESWVRKSNLMCQVATPDFGEMWQPNRLFYAPGKGMGHRRLQSPRCLDSDRAEVLASLECELAALEPIEAAHDLSDAPLQGIRVLDFTNVISGPTCGRTLAECGAEVIKVDRPELTHQPDTTIILGCDVNRGKRSLLLDLKVPEARDVVDRLVRSADAIILNGPDAVIERLGLSFDQLKAVNPQIVVCQVTAFGSPGENAGWSGRQGYDEVVQATSGISLRFGGPNDPLLHGSASCLDYSTGYCAALGIVLGLLNRQATGAGSHVCTSLALAAQFAQLPYCFDYDGRGDWTEPQGQDAIGTGPLDRIYKTSDGWIFLSHPESESDGLLAISDLGLRGDESLSELEKSLESVFPSKSAAEWEVILNTMNVGAHRLWSLAELQVVNVRDVDRPEYFVDSDADDAPVFLRFDHEIGTTVEQLASSWLRSDACRLRMGRAAPRYGADTAAILAELGYGSEELGSLLRSGAVALRLEGSDRYLPA